VRRTQIYLDEEQDRRLAQRAAVLRRTKSEVIRQALDSYLDQPVDEDARLAEFRAAVVAAAGAEPYFTHEYLEELREGDRRRSAELERRWRGEEDQSA